jgi:hypothetical protein
MPQKMKILSFRTCNKGSDHKGLGVFLKTANTINSRRKILKGSG